LQVYFPQQTTFYEQSNLLVSNKIPQLRFLQCGLQGMVTNAIVNQKLTRKDNCKRLCCTIVNPNMLV